MIRHDPQQASHPIEEEPDYIVDEVRAIRRKILEEHGNDLERLFKSLQEDQARSGRKIIPVPPRNVSTPSPPASAE